MRQGSFVIGALLCASLAAAAGRAAEPAAEAESPWPARPIRLIASVTAGTSLDTLARMVAVRLAAALGQGVVVENRAGAAGNIASDLVAKAPPDGHTLLFASNSLATLPAFAGARAVDPLVALAPVSIVASQAMVLVAYPGYAAASFADVAAAARAAPKTVPYATSGVGSLAHLTAEWMQARAGVVLLHIPYSGAQSFKDVISGEVPLAFTFVGTALPLIRNGQLRAIAVTSRQRLAIAPEIPTLDESGLPGFEVLNWQGVLAPAGTPPAVIRRLHAELVRMGGDAEFVARLRAMGFVAVLGSPEQFADELRRETEQWARIVRAAGLKLE